MSNSVNSESGWGWGWMWPRTWVTRSSHSLFPKVGFTELMFWGFPDCSFSEAFGRAEAHRCGNDVTVYCLCLRNTPADRLPQQTLSAGPVHRTEADLCWAFKMPTHLPVPGSSGFTPREISKNISPASQVAPVSCILGILISILVIYLFELCP